MIYQLANALGELFKYLQDAVLLLSLLITVALVGSTIFAGIQYTTAAADSSKVEKAKGRLASNIAVLALFIFSATVLNWILPG
jgi:hypothetical protein